MEHGTLSGYTTHECRCPECTLQNKIYKARWRAGQRRRPMVQARRARNHLMFLLSHGHSIRSLSQQVGVSTDTIADIVDGKKRKISKRIHEKILAGHTENAPYRGLTQRGTSKIKLGRGAEWDRKHLTESAS